MRGTEVSSLLTPHCHALCPQLLLSKILSDNTAKSWEPARLHSIVNIQENIHHHHSSSLLQSSAMYPVRSVQLRQKTKAAHRIKLLKYLLSSE